MSGPRYLLLAGAVLLFVPLARAFQSGGTVGTLPPAAVVHGPQAAQNRGAPSSPPPKIESITQGNVPP
jgi:hypothetical protein